MRSWASRVAISPGSARNTSSSGYGPSREFGLDTVGALGSTSACVARVGCHLEAASIGPGLEVVDRVEDLPPELAKAGPAAIHALFCKGARRQAQKRGRFLRGE